MSDIIGFLFGGLCGLVFGVTAMVEYYEQYENFNSNAHIINDLNTKKVKTAQLSED